MTLKVLRRRCLIREYDFQRVKAEALSPKLKLYDRVEFTPLQLTDLEHQQVIDLLKGKEVPTWSDLKVPAVSLYKLKDHLYDVRYYGWTVNYDEDGYLCVQARKNTPLSRIGWGIFEKDLSVKI